MPMIDLVGQSFQLADRNLSSARTINWYPEIYGADDGTKSRMALIPIPGTVTHLEISANALDTCRGLYLSSSGPAPDFGSRLYGVWGSNLYRFDGSFLNPQLVGAVGNYGTPVSMTDNGFDVLIADGVNLWASPMLDADGLATIRTVGLPYVAGSATDRIKPTHVAVLAQRIVVNSSQSNQFYFGLLGLTEFDTDVGALDFYSAESSSDPIVALSLVNGAIWIWGTRSYEIWRTQNNQDDPFTYVGGSQSAVGCKAKYSTAVIDTMCFWLGSSDVGSDRVYMGTSNEAVVISTSAIHDQIQTCTDRANAIGWCYAEKENMFYVLTFQASDRTFVYDVSTKLWHERLRRNIQSGLWEHYSYVYATRANDYLFCGTLIDGKICRFDNNVYQDHDGVQLVRQRVSPTYYDELMSIMLKELVIDCNVGNTPLLSGQGSDPKLMLEISRDGGSTYGNIKTKSLGQQGQYKRLVRWNGMGSGREIVFRITLSDPIPLSIYQARLDFDRCART